MTDYVAYHALFNERMEMFKNALLTLSLPRQPPFAALHYLRDLLGGGGKLEDLVIDIKDVLLNSAGRRIRMAYSLPAEPRKVLSLDHRLIDAFEKVKASYGSDGNERIKGVVDCFLIHELLHFSQGMGYGRHSGLGGQSPNTLLALDYQADALSVATLTQLALLCPEDFSRNADAPLDADTAWNAYLDSIEAAIGQMEVFTHQIKANLDRVAASEVAFSLDKLQRTAIWQYQYHRALHFNRNRTLADFQILAQPTLHFRNIELAWAADRMLLTKHWPVDGEASLFNRTLNKDSGYVLQPSSVPFAILMASSQYGTSRFARIDYTTDDDHKKLFEGLFEGDLSKSKPFFDKLFSQEPWLIGFNDGDDYPRPGEGGGDDPSGPPYDGGSGGALADMNDDERLDLVQKYMNHSMFPLVVLEWAHSS